MTDISKTNISGKLEAGKKLRIDKFMKSHLEYQLHACKSAIPKRR